MSSGHFHLTYKNVDEIRQKYAQAMQNLKVSNRLKNEKFRVDRTYDIPYVAGYSESGKTVYVDRHLPLVLMINRKSVPILNFLITHERVEKAIMDFMGLEYEDAHKIATYAEHRELKKKDISPESYERVLDPFIKADQHERIERVPSDLDFKPYKDSYDERLISKMRAAQSDPSG